MTTPPDGAHITYQQQYRKCGKRFCGTCRTTPGHGPYWYGYWRAGGRLYSTYIGKERPAEMAAVSVAAGVAVGSLRANNALRPT